MPAGVTLYALEAGGEGVGTGAVMGAWDLPSASYKELQPALGVFFLFLNKLLCSAETAVGLQRALDRSPGSVMV